MQSVREIFQIQIQNPGPGSDGGVERKEDNDSPLAKAYHHRHYHLLLTP